LLNPHMLKLTTWGEREATDKVHIDVDQTAR
jgi:hypothetical protein